MSFVVSGPPPGEAHLWWAHVRELDDPVADAACRALLLPPEATAMQRFMFERNRREYLLTRALCRRVLSHYATVSPSGWEFVRNEHGRPAIASPALAPQLQFNLSNTRDVAICLVAASGEIGADVEWLGRPRTSLDLAQSVFSPEEYRALRACPAAEQLRRFYSYWTLKEAYIKARGIGLSLGLENFTMHLDPEDAIRVSFNNGLLDEPEAWQFALVQLAEDHLAAVAIKRPDQKSLQISVHAGLPR